MWLLAAFAGTAQAQAPTSARVSFTTDGVQTPTVLGHRSRDEAWRRVCTAPCTRRFALGRYALALSLDDGEPVAVAGPPLVVWGIPSSVRVHLDDRSGRRIAGGVLTALGVVLLGAAAGFTFLTFIAAYGDVAYLIATAVTTALTLACGITMIGVGIAMLGAGATATARIGE